jgi:hypothetical protein
VIEWQFRSVRRGPRSAALAILFAASSHGIPAIAGQSEDPEVLFNGGLAAMVAGKYEDGCPAIERSYELDPRPGTLFTLAECEAKRGRKAVAVEHYDNYVAVFQLLPPEKQARQGDRAQVAFAQMASLEPDISAIIMELPAGTPADVTVAIQATVLPGTALRRTKYVEPGEYDITTQVPGGPVVSQHVTLLRGERRRILLGISLVQEKPVSAQPIPTPGPPGPAGKVSSAPSPGVQGSPPGIGLDKSPEQRKAEENKSLVSGAFAVGGIMTVVGLVVVAAASAQPKGTLQDKLYASSAGSFALAGAGGLFGILLLATTPSPAPVRPSTPSAAATNAVPRPNGAVFTLNFHW